MADLRPLHGLRYDSAVVGDLGGVLAPPYDVISKETQAALYQRSPYNIVRLEFRLEDLNAEANRYQAAAATLADWRRAGALASDKRPAIYLYEQEFTHGGQVHRRRTIIARVRLEPWERGIILPHEHTMSGPKQDRLRLLRACRTNVSPVFSLYRPDGGAAIAICESGLGGSDPLQAEDSLGQRHRLWMVDDRTKVEHLRRHFSDKSLYIADGHHRYETALAYREERREAAASWSGEEPENYVLMGLTAADDEGLLILPIHRLVRPVQSSPHLVAALGEYFDVELRQAHQAPPFIDSLVDHLRSVGTTRVSFAALGLEQAQTALITLRDRPKVESMMPAGHSAAWRGLGVNVLQYGIFEPLLGIDIETVRSGGQVEFTESADEARAAVEAGSFPLAFLLSPTRPEEIFAVADAGDRMPQKSTFFYPKLGTGLVMYAHDDHPGTEQRSA